jgi:hypothetical protein
MKEQRGFIVTPLILLAIKAGAVLLAVAAVIGAYKWHASGLREEGRAEVRAQWLAADQAASKANAEETARRLAAQQANQEKQNAELAASRAAADRVALASERMRRDHQAAADIWGHTLRNSPTGADLEAAAEAVRVSTELLGRARTRAGVLARFADAAHAAGSKCERDYATLTP